MLIALRMASCLFIATSFWMVMVTAQTPNTPAITYQGRLLVNGSPANGTYDLQCRLYFQRIGGAQVGSTLNIEDVPVQNGLFTVQLNFGLNTYDGTERHIQIAFRPGNSTGAFTNVFPRQIFTPAPVAITLVPHRKTIRLPAKMLNHNSFVTPMDEGLIFPGNRQPNDAGLARAMIPMPPDWDQRSTLTVTLFYRILDTPSTFQPVVRFELGCTGRRIGGDLFADPTPLRSIDSEPLSASVSELRRQRFQVPASRFIISGQSADVIQINSLKRVPPNASVNPDSYLGGVILMALEIAYTGYR